MRSYFNVIDNFALCRSKLKITQMHRLKNDTLDVPERLEPQSFPIEYADQETTGGYLSPAVEKMFG